MESILRAQSSLCQQEPELPSSRITSPKPEQRQIVSFALRDLASCSHLRMSNAPEDEVSRHKRNDKEIDGENDSLNAPSSFPDPLSPASHGAPTTNEFDALGSMCIRTRAVQLWNAHKNHHHKTRGSHPRNRSFNVAERVTGLSSPMNPLERKRREFFGAESPLVSTLSRSSRRIATSILPNHHQRQPRLSRASTVREERPQYRLKSRNNGRDSSSNGGYSYDPNQETTCCSFLSSNSINAYIHWSFTAPVIVLIVSLTAMFFVLTAMFAIIIFGLGRYQPSCFYVGTRDFEEAGLYFVDAFAISWTTFSTVGYGMASPALSNPHNTCLLWNVFAAAEALYGVLYAGFAGAILFGRITRTNSQANVLWSEPIVIRYGPGVRIEHKCADGHNNNNLNWNEHNAKNKELSINQETDYEEEINDCDETKSNFPILEFRLHNTFFNRQSGEITNATINVWASTLADFAPDSIIQQAKLKQKRRRIKRPRLRRLSSPRLAWKKTSGQDESTATTMAKTASQAGGAQAAAVFAGENAVPPPSALPRQVVEMVGNGRPSKKKGACKSGRREAVVESTISDESGSELSSCDFDYSSSESLSLDSLSLKPKKNSKKSRRRRSTVMTIKKAMQKGRETAYQEVADLMSTCISKRHIALMEDPNNDLVPQLIYSRLDIETGSHPFFKRGWMIRHHLNPDSPLLSNEALERIKANKGRWPTEWNDCAFIRKHLKFHEIVATLSGTDNNTAKTVYSQKIYEFSDINIGYCFVSDLMVVDPQTGALGIDHSLINHVVEQHGGGGEPLSAFQSQRVLDAADRRFENEEKTDVELGGMGAGTNSANAGAILVGKED